MKGTLFERLLGSWTLVELIEVPVDGGEITYPMGRQPKGIIMYSPDGYMSAQIMNSDRSYITEEHAASAPLGFFQPGATYLAYSGPFYTDDEKQIVKHTMYVSLFPDWTGETQSRLVHFSAGLLHLESGQPFIANGRLVIHRLTWERVEQ